MSVDSESIESQFNINGGNSKKDSIYEFEGFRLDVYRLMLYRKDQEVDLAPKVVETLLALIERSGKIVAKEELFERLWKGSFVDESNLTQNIYLLRKTLGNTADERPLIETFRRRGYRFNGKVKLTGGNKAQIQDQSSSIQSKRFFDSLAVLPFKNESADPNLEYLSDGITESIINLLAEISTLRVVARSTVFRYKNQDLTPQEIGRELGVDAILTGRVLQLNDRLIVRTELVDVAKGWQLWGEQYDRRPSDILELQEIIAREISENLRLKLTATEQKRLTKRYTESTEAYHLYIKGRYHLNKRLTETIEQAAGFFAQAIDVDPAYAPAYVGLADCYPLLSLYGTLTPKDAYPRARAAAEKALEIDMGLTKAHNSLGVVKLFYEWDWPGAEAAFRQAIRLSPHYPDAHQRYGMLLTAVGRFDEAEAEFELARELDPLSLITITLSGYPFYYARQYEKAVKRFSSVIALDANYSMAHFRLGLSLAHQQKYEDAIAELRISNKLSNDRDTIAALGYVQGLSVDLSGAEAALAALANREKHGFVSAYDRALVYLGLGRHEEAMGWLEKAFVERSYWLIYLKVDPALDPLRQMPRFNALLRRVFQSRIGEDI